MTDWKVVPAAPAYEISSNGRLRRRVGCRSRKPGAEIAGFVVKGYRIFRVTNPNGERVNFLAHRLVCEAWNGPCPEGHECAHFDGDRLNNTVQNLRWATRKENAADRSRHGTQAAENASKAKLNWATVRDIRAAHTGRYGQVTAFARRYGVSRQAIKDIIYRKTWIEREAANV